MTAEPPKVFLASAEPSVKTENRDRSRALGAILVEIGRLSVDDVRAIQDFAIKRGLLFGDAGIQLNLLRRDDVEYALARQYNYALIPRGGAGGVADEVVAAYSPQTLGVEKLRDLRSQLTIGWLRQVKRPVLTVVSPERADGRSWLAANLATLFAQNGHRTLLMDANLRNPQQHRLFNLDNSVGLSSLLTGRAGREIAHRIHQKLRLFVMPAGIVPPNPQELLSRPVFSVVLDHCATQFDVILIDTPAVDESSDAIILSVHAGSALLMARQDRTSFSGLSASFNKLRRAGVNVVGSVLSEH